MVTSCCCCVVFSCAPENVVDCGDLGGPKADINERTLQGESVGRVVFDGAMGRTSITGHGGVKSLTTLLHMSCLFQVNVAAILEKEQTQSIDGLSRMFGLPDAQFCPFGLPSKPEPWKNNATVRINESRCSYVRYMHQN